MKVEVLSSLLKNRWMEFSLSVLYERLARWILSILILAILSGMLGSVIITILHLRLLFSMDIEHALRIIIIDVLTILAVRRVKVTYIIDTVIVVMLTEVMACWYKEFNLYKMGMMTFLVLALCIMRIFTVKYSPSIKRL